MWKRIMTNPQRWAWVAEGPQGIVGFVLFGPPRDKNREGYIELGAIYLLAFEKGKGVGFSLLSVGFNKMKDLGYKKAYCRVLENNPTIKFYERSGAQFSNQVKEDDIEEVSNYERAMNEGLAKLSKLPVCARLIKEIHSTLMAGVRGSNKTPGEYRKSQNWVG